jgi:hypothetical protein
MAIVKLFLNMIEKINFKYSFFNFELKGWADEAYKNLEKDKYVLRKFFTDSYNKINYKITGK